jgi:hypothetical protein
MTALLTETIRDLTTRLDEALMRWQGEKLTRRELRNLVGSTDVLAGIILSTWKWLRDTLEEEGFEGRELKRRCQLMLYGIDWILAAHERFLARAAASGLTAEAAGLRDLEAKLPALREARPNVDATLSVASRPPRSVEKTVLADSKAALERGEFITVDDDYLARLRAGEDF